MLKFMKLMKLKILQELSSVLKMIYINKEDLIGLSLLIIILHIALIFKTKMINTA